jgi:hypothetical protein
MDLSIGLLGVLAIVGYNFTTRRNPAAPIRHKVSAHDVPNGETVYESKDYKKVGRQEKNKLTEFYKQSMDVKNTNKYSVASNLKSKGPVVPKQVQFAKEPMPDVTQGDQQIFAGPMFNMGMRYYVEPDTSQFNEKEKFSTVSKLTDRRADFSHQNMVPFFGGHPPNNLNNNTETILSRHNGEYRPPKMETFSTLNPAENVFGTPIAELDKSRFITSNKLTNELPFDQEKIAPIPQELLRPEYRTVDEMRVDTNKKYTYEGRINHRKMETMLGTIGEVSKNQPERFYDNSAERYFTNATADHLKQPLVNYGDVFKQTLNKQLTESEFNLGGVQNQRMGAVTRIGTAADAEANAGKPLTNYGGDTKNTYHGDWVRNNKNTVGKRDVKAQNSYHASEQERETTSRADLIGLKGTDAMYRGLEDTAKTTNKENVLYAYSGNMDSVGVHVPARREQYYSAEFQTKPSMSYTPGGVHSKGTTVESVSMELSNKVAPVDYFGNHDALISNAPSSLGQVSYKYNAAEHDFSDRIALK